MAYTFKPTDATTISVVYGVEDALTGYIIQDINVSEDVNTVQIPDQKGAIAQILPFQHHYTVSFTAIGPNTAPATVGSTLTIGGIVYYVNSCERRANYNDTQKWGVQMEAWQGAVTGSTTLGPSGN